MILIRSNLHIIENKEEMVVNVTISCADRPLTTVKNKVSIAIKKRRSSVKPFNNGYILINLFIYSTLNVYSYYPKNFILSILK